MTCHGVLAAAIRAAAAGMPTLHPTAASKMMRQVQGDHAKQEKQARISPREMEVLSLIARGFGNKKIAKELFISERTVKTHVTHLLEKLELGDRTQLAIYAINNKLVEP